MTVTTAEKIAEYACSTATDPDSLKVARLCLFDWVSVAMAARQEPVTRAIMAVEGENGGAALSSALGMARKLPPRGAAMVNGTAGHALDFDDTHFAHIGHVSAVVMPAALVVAEQQGADGKAFVNAIVQGAEASIRAGMWLGRSHYEAGFHQTATAGVFGAVVAAAGLRGLNRARAGMAIALAASRASGLKTQFGTMAKPYHAGMAAAAGIEAVQAAAHGLTANPSALDGAFGFGATHAGLGDARVFETGSYLFPMISHKYYACCHGTHAAIEALSPFRGAEGVERVEIRVHPRWLDVCDIKAPRTRLEAKFSLTLTGAMALLGLPMTSDDAFEPQVIEAPDLLTLRDKVEVQGDPALPDTAAHVTVSAGTGGGEAYHDLAQPAAMDARAAKLREKSRALLGAGASDALWRHIAAPDGPDPQELGAMLRAA